jgi:uncharacterized membrane protein
MSVLDPHARQLRADARGVPADALDQLGARLQELARDALPTGGIREALQGHALGHALHPVLTDLPIGFFTSAFVLDVAAGRHARRASQRLVALGLLSIPPTALTGWAELADAPATARRTGALHAIANVTGSLAYLASWQARRRGHHLRGFALGALGGAVLTVGGALGGKLAFEQGVGVGARGRAALHDERLDRPTDLGPDAGAPRATASSALVEVPN